MESPERAVLVLCARDDGLGYAGQVVN
jgi:hypothetical protein